MGEDKKMKLVTAEELAELTGITRLESFKYLPPGKRKKIAKLMGISLIRLDNVKKLTPDERKKLAKLMGIKKDHLEKIKYLTTDERRKFHYWLTQNLDTISGWTGIAPEVVRVAVDLRNEPSEANFILNIRAKDLEAWKVLKDKDGGPNARLTRLRNALRTADDILWGSVNDSEFKDLLGQAISHFSPPGDDLGHWCNGIIDLLEVVEAAMAFNGKGGAEPLPDWFDVMIEYLQYKGCDWENFRHLMWVFGFRKNDGKEKWKETLKQEKGPEWENPGNMMPRMSSWLRYGARIVAENKSG